MGIAQVILRLRCIYAKRYGLTPQAINSGGCSAFAGVIVDAGFGSVIWSATHCFIMYNDKFYDIECPQGCSHPDDLPFYQRE